MIIGGMQKLTLLDYPGLTACLIFTRGCNFRCPYCHNSSLLEGNIDLIPEEEVFSYLEKRIGLIDGVVISGGEPTLQKDLKEFIIKIKNLGFKVKLDTNGTNPELLKELIKDKLIDYVAMDIKTDINNYEKVTKLKVCEKNILKSIEILETSTIDYEFRTTICKGLHVIRNLENIVELLNPKSKYYLQNYKDNESNLNPIGLESFTEEELKLIQASLSQEHSNVFIR